MSLFLQKKLILGSNSPRRKEILAACGFNFVVEVRETDESFDQALTNQNIPLFLAKQKAMAFENSPADTLILTADTVVVVENQVLNKPQSKEEAEQMLQLLSHKTHFVYTACCIKDGQKYLSFYDQTAVTFRNLSRIEIQHYVANYTPMDKAGAYGVQDFIGMIGIEKIEGSFYTVMGLPIHLVYAHLSPYITNL